MKIGGKKPGIGSDVYVNNVGKPNAQVKKTDGGGTKASADSVDISSRAREFSKAGSLIESLPEVRGEMVVRLKTEIEQGDYYVDAEKVATKMIERALRDALYAKK